ncbi:hypothetical protein HMPREF1318_0266 [Actinomyces massiliensis F0489]|uniref:Uncharacterized protein n=1 Tax=Actinomyces massiliensis F0489 TaxID=1125718 RepID=J1HFT4_9ACTO|nr:hypothetical protein HMPREF1318_0266 [Actinomyces massiliensis F0489]
MGARQDADRGGKRPHLSSTHNTAGPSHSLARSSPTAAAQANPDMGTIPRPPAGNTSTQTSSSFEFL